MAVISVNGLSKSFSYHEKLQGLGASIKSLFIRKKLQKEAVKSISFDVERSEFIGFIGPNGAGKTTTLKMLTGILFPTSGEARVLGYVPWDRKKALLMRFALVMGQKSQLIWDLPATETFYINKTIYEVEDKKYKKIVGELAELLDVKGLLNIQVRRLSLGERMKMEFIASLIHEPEILFLDEPTIGLDVLSQKKIREFLKDYNRNKRVTIVLTSHYMHDIEELCERVILIHLGSILFDGSLKEMSKRSGSTKIIRIELERPVPAIEVARFGAVKEHTQLSVTIEIERELVKEKAKAMLETLPLVDLTIADIPIEETVANMYRNPEKS